MKHRDSLVEFHLDRYSLQPGITMWGLSARIGLNTVFWTRPTWRECYRAMLEHLRQRTLEQIRRNLKGET